ncbi:MAG: nucleoside diphosphate kinase regulator [Thermoclostridium sp.]|nr:nucleoside diphosphate kinase regulator [Thermoclostridium sp.]
MTEPFVSLRPEVTRENALTLVQWLKDDEVRKYLSDPQDVSANIEQVINRVNLPVLTHFFNRSGRFYIACNKQNKPVGFVRLVQKGTETEIVIVIGDRNNWGKRLGTVTIRESLKIAFFEFRSLRVTAKIHKDNKRSIKAFINAGFQLEYEAQTMKQFSLTMEQYLKSIQERVSVRDMIYITEVDKERLKRLLEGVFFDDSITEKAISDLEHEIERATVVKPEELPENIITMNSRALLYLNGDESEVSLVYPDDADWSEQKLSIFSPIGMAILGYSEGDTIQWEVPSGVTEIQIQKILYQPEAAGHYHL